MSDSRTSEFIERIPVGPLALMPLDSIQPLGQKVDEYLSTWRTRRESDHKETIAFNGYQKDSYIVQAKVSRFGSGEAKANILETVRGVDLYLMVDVMNYSQTYSLFGQVNHMSPDDHYSDLKRVIAATTGKAKRINVIMPFMYESRQHKRTGRESLDCAMMLQELHAMGVENFITFDAHDPRVMNAIPQDSFDNISCSYQFIKAILSHVEDLDIDKNHMMIISPDEGGMSRAIYYANVLGIDMGMFYKRRDYSKVVNGRNPIVAHEFLGADVEGKDVFIIDDMISSGESLIDTAKELKERKARRVFACCTFGLFTSGFNKFDQAYANGTLNGVFTTNLIYQQPELLTKPWYISVDMAKYIALIIDNLNHDMSISSILDSSQKINDKVAAYRAHREEMTQQMELPL
ncbi:MAG: ribose-phosphate pyrophosphokinase [Lachnospiraceae bacterium]|nr:ribose-phosphate pyrophosphokinase [Lachnospiraceae bacterium]